MRLHRSMFSCSLRAAAVAGLLIPAGLAMANPIGFMSSHAGTPTPSSGGGGYSPRVNPLRGVSPGDTASMGLFMFDANFNFAPVNTGGDALVTRGANASLGGNNNGSSNVTGFWDEVVLGNTVVIRAAFGTASGEPLLPMGSQVPTPGGGSAPAAFWTWRFGGLDPVNFMDHVTQVRLIRATVSFSADRGQSYFSTISHTTSIPNRNNWNPASDDGLIVSNIGDGMNYVMLQYEIEVVPTPGPIALMAGGLFALAARRRR
jgi:hypothetical protein